jgi:hypothetical protein
VSTTKREITIKRRLRTRGVLDGNTYKYMTWRNNNSKFSSSRYAGGMKQRRDMVIRSQKVKRNQQFAWMTHTRVGTTQKYREKVIEQGKVLMCCANTHRVWGASQAPPHCAVSLVNKIPESRGKLYKPGAVEPIICN